MANWQITSRQLATLWNSVYPRIVALAWQSNIYLDLFESSHTFRRHEFDRILGILGAGFQLDPGMEICVRDSERRTDLLITPEGLIFPLPETTTPERRPFRNRLFEAYHLGGGRLPQVNRDLSQDQQFIHIQKWYIPLFGGQDPLAGSALPPATEIDLVQDVLNQPNRNNANARINARGLPQADAARFLGLSARLFQINPQTAQITDGGAHENVNGDPDASRQHCLGVIRRAMENDDFFIGAQFRILEDQVPRIIARAWDDATYRDEYLGDVRNQDGDLLDPDVRRRIQRDKLVDISLPRRINIAVSNQINDIIIDVASSGQDPEAPVDWTLRLPYLPQPDRPDMFREMISGYASIPLYTNSYT